MLAVVDTFDAIMSDRSLSQRGAAGGCHRRAGNNRETVRSVHGQCFWDVQRQGSVNFVDLYGREVDMGCLNPSARYRIGIGVNDSTRIISDTIPITTAGRSGG